MKAAILFDRRGVSRPDGFNLYRRDVLLRRSLVYTNEASACSRKFTSVFLPFFLSFSFFVCSLTFQIRPLSQRKACALWHQLWRLLRMTSISCIHTYDIPLSVSCAASWNVWAVGHVLVTSRLKTRPGLLFLKRCHPPGTGCFRHVQYQDCLKFSLTNLCGVRSFCEYCPILSHDEQKPASHLCV